MEWSQWAMDTSMGIDDAEFWYGWVNLTSCSIRANADGEVDGKYKAMKTGLLDVHEHNLPSEVGFRVPIRHTPWSPMPRTRSTSPDLMKPPQTRSGNSTQCISYTIPSYLNIVTSAHHTPPHTPHPHAPPSRPQNLNIHPLPIRFPTRNGLPRLLYLL